MQTASPDTSSIDHALELPEHLSNYELGFEIYRDDNDSYLYLQMETATILMHHLRQQGLQLECLFRDASGRGLDAVHAADKFLVRREIESTRSNLLHTITTVPGIGGIDGFNVPEEWETCTVRLDRVAFKREMSNLGWGIQADIFVNESCKQRAFKGAYFVEGNTRTDEYVELAFDSSGRIGDGLKGNIAALIKRHPQVQVTFT